MSMGVACSFSPCISSYVLLVHDNMDDHMIIILQFTDPGSLGGETLISTGSQGMEKSR